MLIPHDEIETVIRYLETEAAQYVALGALHESWGLRHAAEKLQAILRRQRRLMTIRRAQESRYVQTINEEAAV